MSAGIANTCARNTTGYVYCWGDNSDGQVGNGHTTQEDKPTKAGASKSWTAVSAGDDYACGRRMTGTLYCWGDNASGQLGDGTTTGRLVPTRVG